MCTCVYVVINLTHTCTMHALVSTFYVRCSTHTCTPTHMHTHMHMHARMHAHTHTHTDVHIQRLSPAALTLSIGTCTYYCNVPYTITYTHIYFVVRHSVCVYMHKCTHTLAFSPGFSQLFIVAYMLKIASWYSLRHLKSWEDHGDDATHVCCALLCGFVMLLTH